MRLPRSPRARAGGARRFRVSGRCRASRRRATRTSQMPFSELPPHVPDDNETGLYRRSFDGAARLAPPAGRPLVRRLRGRAVRRRQRRAGRHRKGRAHSCGVRHLRARPPRPSERARRGGRSLVGCVVHRGPGPVVARRPAALDRARLAVDRRSRRARRARRRLPQRPADGSLGRRRRRASRRRRRSRRRSGRARRRPLRVRGSRAAAVVGRAARALHARAERRRRDGLRATSASGTSRCATAQLLVNGEPVRINGVNRHEHDDATRPRADARVDGDATSC